MKQLLDPAGGLQKLECPQAAECNPQTCLGVYHLSDCWHDILLFLEGEHVCRYFSRVNVRFAAMSNCPYLWKRLTIIDLGSSGSSGNYPSVYDLFVETEPVHFLKLSFSNRICDRIDCDNYVVRRWLFFTASRNDVGILVKNTLPNVVCKKPWPGCSNCEGGDHHLDRCCRKVVEDTARCLPGIASRKKLIHQLFVFFDVDGDKFLNLNEMYGFFLYIGLEKPGPRSEQTWPTNYGLLCQLLGTTSLAGFNEGAIQRFVSDHADTGVYFTNENLKTLVRGLQSPVNRPQTFAGRRTQNRAFVLRQVFCLCDRDADGRLNKEEMLHLMELKGYRGNKQEREDEYRLLCIQHDRDPTVGINQDVFLSLVDVSGASLYCSNYVLEGMLEKLFLEFFPVEPNEPKEESFPVEPKEPNEV